MSFAPLAFGLPRWACCGREIPPAVHHAAALLAGVHLPALPAPAQLLTRPNIHRPSCRSGEVVVRGPSVFAGYYKAQVGGAGVVAVQHGRLFWGCHVSSLGVWLFAFFWCLVGVWCPSVYACVDVFVLCLQDKTDEVLDKDGWFHTGEAAVLQLFYSCSMLNALLHLHRPAGRYSACCTACAMLVAGSRAASVGWLAPACGSHTLPGSACATACIQPFNRSAAHARRHWRADPGRRTAHHRPHEEHLQAQPGCASWLEDGFMAGWLVGVLPR